MLYPSYISHSPLEERAKAHSLSSSTFVELISIRPPPRSFPLPYKDSD